MPPPLRFRQILAASGAALAWVALAAAPASAHSVSGVGATNFHTNLRSVSPEPPGLEVRVVESGSRLEVRNGGAEVLVLGYKGEPYLRIGPDGVFQNLLSTASYINATRKGSLPPVSAQNAKVGDTDWERISSDPVARWHDHRIHWMLPTNPPAVSASPGRTHVVIPEWVVDLRQGSQAITVKGDLVWKPGGSALPWFVVIAALLALVVFIGLSPAWAGGLAAVVAALVAVDVVHALGLGLANAGGLGHRLGQAFTGSPFAALGWVAGVVAVVGLRRRRPDGLSVAALAGLLVAFLGGVSDLSVLSHSDVPFGFGGSAARLLVAASIGLGLGLAVVAALRSTGVGGRVGGPADRGAPAEPSAAPAGP